MPKLFKRMIEGDPRRPDYYEDEKKKRGFPLFWHMLGLHFWDLMKVNLLFVLFTLPLIAWTILYMGIAAERLNLLQADYIQFILDILPDYLLGCIPALALAGPPAAALTGITKEWAEDRHVFLWSDFKDALKKHWKQSALSLGLLGVLLSLGYLAINFYGSYAPENLLFRILQISVVFILFLGVGAYFYLMPMLVSYAFSFRDLLRNSLLFAATHLLRTLLCLLLAVCPIILFLVLSFFSPYSLPIMLGYYLLLGFALTAFINSSLVNPTFLKIFGKVRNEDTVAYPGEENAP